MFSPFNSGKVGTGMWAQIGSICGLSGLPMALSYLKIALDIGRVFAKCLIFDDLFSSGLPIGCLKVRIPIRMVKKY